MIADVSFLPKDELKKNSVHKVNGNYGILGNPKNERNASTKYG